MLASRDIYNENIAILRNNERQNKLKWKIKYMLFMKMTLL
jgi:hypothetical protein